MKNLKVKLQIFNPGVYPPTLQILHIILINIGFSLKANILISLSRIPIPKKSNEILHSIPYIIRNKEKLRHLFSMYSLMINIHTTYNSILLTEKNTKQIDCFVSTEGKYLVPYYQHTT